MTNFDKNIDSMDTLYFAVKNGVPANCSEISCRDCDFYPSINCMEKRILWLKSEYVEPKINIPEDTPIDAKVLVSDDGENWFKRYYAGFENGRNYVWVHCGTSWSADGDKIDMWEYMKLAEEVE